MMVITNSHINYVIDIFKKYLNVKNIELNDNFIKLGGHSLSAAQMLMEIHKTYHVKIPMRIIFTKNIEELACYISQCSEKGEAHE